jgi:hypothetical protein
MVKFIAAFLPQRTYTPIRTQEGTDLENIKRFLKRKDIPTLPAEKAKTPMKSK